MKRSQLNVDTVVKHRDAIKAIPEIDGVARALVFIPEGQEKLFTEFYKLFMKASRSQSGGIIGLSSALAWIPKRTKPILVEIVLEEDL